MAMLQSPSSSSFSYAFTYDVFLSFRGSDTRYGFTGNLYRALCDKGIRTFIDDEELQRGDEITQSLVKAIEETKIFIPVFSISYASSSFCLDELVHIIQCFKEKGHLVLPVFYGVDPSHVRHQTGSYGEAIAKQEEKFKKNKEKYINNMERLQKWKIALNQAANLSGHHFNPRNEYEYEFIGKLVKEVSNKINRASLYIADYPVGLESRLLEVNSLLDVASHDEVRMIGIHGIGGIGKSTLARAAYNLIADQFQGLCFLHDMREISAKHGLAHLQEKLLSKTIGLNIKFGHTSEGIPIIKERLQQKKILLVLDDVDELKQLQVIVGEPNWFGPGSRVIITTRDKHLLASHEIERTYEVDKLNEKEALELLRWKTFKNKIVDPSYEGILNRAVTFASGLPLALEVVGSNLSGKDIDEWKSTLDWYERIPDKKIQKILKVSFDALEEFEQSVFLDIACCFKGYELSEVEDILHAHYGYCMKHQIGVLVEKSLIKIRQWDYTYVTLHDLVENMGKEIVRQESPKYCGKRSRLWFHEDIIQVLETNSGTSEIEIIYLQIPSCEKVVEWKGDELKKMENLKTLIVKNGRFTKGPEYLPNSLRVLEWHRYPSPDIPSDFWGKKLSICKLGESCLTSRELSSSFKRFVNIRELNLDCCQYLTQILDVSDLLNLEIFSFQYCENLIAIHESFGFLNKLKILNAEGCIKLKSFPPIKLTSLQQLKLSYCESLESFPEILGEMENITSILLWGISIEELPFSFQNLTGLRTLRINGLGMIRLPSSIFKMANLEEIDAACVVLPKQSDKPSSMVFSNVQELRLTNCNLSDEFLPIVLTWFANVEFLDLSGDNFTVLPECIKECCILWGLRLDDCKCLREIRGVPPNLKHLSVLRCKSLTSSCRSMFLNQELHEAGGTTFRLAGFERIPKWFEHQSMGPSISFWFRNSLPSLALFVATKSMHKKCPNNKHLSLGVNLFINGYKCILDSQSVGICLVIQLDHAFLFDLKLQDWVLSEEYGEFQSKLDQELLKNKWIHAEITFEEEEEDEVEVMIPLLQFHIESGIYVLKQKSGMEDIQFTTPYKKRKLDEYLNGSQSQFHPLLKKHRFMDVEVSETELVQQQHRSYGFIVTAITNGFIVTTTRTYGSIVRHVELGV